MTTIDAPRRRKWPCWSTRSLLAMVAVAAISLGWVRWQIDCYRREWQVEHDAIAAMRSSGANVGVGTIVVGPRWLRALAGPRSRYFERVDRLFFVASDSSIAWNYTRSFKHLRMVLQD